MRTVSILRSRARGCCAHNLVSYSSAALAASATNQQPAIIARVKVGGEKRTREREFRGVNAWRHDLGEET